MTQKVGIVVPTLGTRHDYLEMSLRSIRAAGKSHVLVVAPESFDASRYLKNGLIDQFVEDPKKGLAEAINLGFKMLPKEILLINWLGDDDLLSAGSLGTTSSALLADSEAAFVYGACDYVDENGKKIWTNKSGPWAVSLLRVGPDLIPQPGALFRRDAFNRVGELSAKFSWAFDFDLFIKLSKVGRGIYLPVTLASFRWHPNSLSVGMRKKSVSEASLVRKIHLPAWIRPISFIWEWPIMILTLVAGSRVSVKSRLKKSKL